MILPLVFFIVLCAHIALAGANHVMFDRLLALVDDTAQVLVALPLKLYRSAKVQWFPAND
jgi:hypothetical protein